MPRRTASRILILLLAGLAAGCAVQPVVTQAERDRLWQRHREALASLDKWEARGRIAVRVGRKGWTASINWRQDARAYDAHVFGPLGRNRYELRGDDHSVQLHTDDGRRLYARDAESLMRQNLGWGVPVSGFIYWMRGLPAPDSRPADLALDDDGRLVRLSQDGWQVSYDDYRHSGGMDLPGRITLQRGDLHLRLIILDWAV
jgi:outer membrane lipoprotein LolB